MAIVSNVKNKKRERSLVILAGLLFFLLLAVLFLNSRKIDFAANESLAPFSNKTRQTVQGILQDLSTIEEFFIDKKLEKFKEYIPIQKPDTYGRENPFDTF